MANFEGAIDKGDTVLMEVSVLALNTRAAKLRGTVWLLGRHPTEVSAVESIRVRNVGDGTFSEHRVIVELNKEKGLRDLLKVEAAKSAIDDML